MSRIYGDSHIVLTSHPSRIFGQSPKLSWGHGDPRERGPVVGTLGDPRHRNAIGSHSGSYAVYRALAVAAGQMAVDHRPDLTDTNPITEIGPHPAWSDPEKIVCLDPWGARVHAEFTDYYERGYDIRPTIAITAGHIDMPEIASMIDQRSLEVDGTIVQPNGGVSIVKAAVEPVWYLPGIAKRIGTDIDELRKMLFARTAGMFPELITRPDLDILLPPVGGLTAYIFGDPTKIGREGVELTARVHDECNGSDVFGSDICTCRPYLVHGIEEAVRTAQRGGVGLIVYFRKEGRALGEVTKFLVYNARKRQSGGDRAEAYFERTECVAGVEDMRFQELMPDVLHWLGATRIDNLVSMSDMKHDAIVDSGIEVIRRVAIPEDRIPRDAHVEIAAKKAAGYFDGANGPAGKGSLGG